MIEYVNQKMQLSLLWKIYRKALLPQFQLLLLKTLMLKDQCSPIPQLDGYASLTTEENLEEDKLWRFCDEEFNDVEEYLKHMKKHRFMCYNCLDYFTEKSWFSHSDLIFGKTGAILKT